MQISIVLFDEIEKASDALWNLLLGILDKGTLTLGDNQRVDFSRSLIFMTGNLGAAEMNALLSSRLGFAPPDRKNERLGERITASGVEAARRRFTPEFMNRIDKIVVFKPLGTTELEKILDIELNAVQRRLFQSTPGCALELHVSETGKRYLLREGTDTRYGARHLKRAIDRLLVQPLANLIATEQVLDGDVVSVDFCSASGELLFWKESTNQPRQEEVAVTTYEDAEILHSDFAAPVRTMAPQTQLAPV